ncbi:tetrapyrrole-binding protein [Seminavis robusta]|uniref:Tetrapyrrole-binding protein n=1 Tax=Seminavis robusta TaxID=568900 RepID=A0A9N8HMW9_9STRA|nr:tetrapyrrole-binding protein [Seminavis robusta]|eukprot:Sro1157_g247370.1 tetrapyrrole-binding protein (219) ;mRNA; f:16120-16975
MMRAPSTVTLAFFALLCASVQGFGVVPAGESRTQVALSDAPPAVSDASEVADVAIPTNLPSEKGIDYVPLATMLATGQLAEADQFTRDALIELSGAKDKGRNFVYFTDVKRIPGTDLATIERLWSEFSGGKFGYSVQKRKYRQSKGDFEAFCRKIGWTTKEGEVERKKRWFGASEFIYDVKKAPEGHLPLTSALRGTSLIKNILAHPVFDDEEWKKQP